MKAWSYWFPDLAVHVPGCPQMLMEHELRRTAQAFFRATRAWKVDQALKPITALTESVVVVPDLTTQDLVRVEAAWFDGRKMDPTTADGLDGQYMQGWHEITGAPDRYLELEPGVLRLFPLPQGAAATGLKLRLSVAPSEAATGLPDDIALRYRDEMHVGAKARLMLMPGKPWTNFDLAGVYGTTFGSMVNTTTVRAAMGHVQARLPSSPTWC